MPHTNAKKRGGVKGFIIGSLPLKDARKKTKVRVGFGEKVSKETEFLGKGLEAGEKGRNHNVPRAGSGRGRRAGFYVGKKGDRNREKRKKQRVSCTHRPERGGGGRRNFG